jgi:hypothetical protein
MKVIQTFIVLCNNGTTQLYLMENGEYMLNDIIYMSTGNWQNDIHFISDSDANKMINDFKEATKNRARTLENT